MCAKKGSRRRTYVSESTVIWLEIYRILILCMNYILTCLVESHAMNPKTFLVLESPDFSRGEYVNWKHQGSKCKVLPDAIINAKIYIYKESVR